jgi:hypothetical protein
LSTSFGDPADEEEPMGMGIRATSRHRTAAATVALLLLLTAVVAPMRAARAQSDEITGDYAVTLVYADIPTDLANGSMDIGHWKLTFAADGTYQEARLDLGVMVTGTYELNGDELKVTDTGGLLSCTNVDAQPGGDQDVSTASYTYKLDSRSLTLTPKSEQCAMRRVVFSTRAFTFYVACATTALKATPAATPVSPGSYSSDESGVDALSGLSSPASPTAASGGATPESSDVTGQIDTLLKQLTACWATGDPARFLPLLSANFQSQFLSGSDQQNLDALNSLKAAMQVQIVWERAGDIEQTADNEVQAVVRTTAADQEQFTRYVFVEENGAWRWDGTTS